IQFEQKFATDFQAVVDLETSVKMGVIDQAFPSDGCARLFEIDTHHNEQFSLVPVFLGFEFPRVFQCRLWVMNRTRANDYQQAVIGAMQNAMNSPATF